MKREWRDSCIKHHANWTYMFWDRAAAVELLQTRYPWFTASFLSYKYVVSQGEPIQQPNANSGPTALFAVHLHAKI